MDKKRKRIVWEMVQLAVADTLSDNRVCGIANHPVNFYDLVKGYGGHYDITNDEIDFFINTPLCEIVKERLTTF